MVILGPTQSSDLALFKSFLEDPKIAIPLNSNFLIGFKDIPIGIQNFDDQTISSLEPEKWKVEKIKNSLISIIESPTVDGNTNYCLFGQGIVLPSESLKTGRNGPENLSEHAGGLLSGVTAANRESQALLSTTFLETNYSFVDFLIRPWIIAASHYGLRERKNNSIKTDMIVLFFDKHNNNKIRKVYKFFQCVPVSFDGITAAYGDNTLVLPKVNWIYNYYTISSET